MQDWGFFQVQREFEEDIFLNPYTLNYLTNNNLQAYYTAIFTAQLDAQINIFPRVSTLLTQAIVTTLKLYYLEFILLSSNLLRS